LTVAPSARILTASATTGATVRVQFDPVPLPHQTGRQDDRRDPTLNSPDLGGARLLGRDPVVVLGHHAVHRRVQPVRGRVMADLADVRRDDASAGLLDALQQDRLHVKAAYQPVEVGDDEYLGVARFDLGERGGQSGPLVERLAAAYVDLFEDAREVESFAFAQASDPVALDAGGREPFGFFAAVCLADSYDGEGVPGHALYKVPEVSTLAPKGSTVLMRSSLPPFEPFKQARPIRKQMPDVYRLRVLR
jgi:hypothetical protein